MIDHGDNLDRAPGRRSDQSESVRLSDAQCNVGVDNDIDLT